MNAEQFILTQMAKEIKLSETQIKKVIELLDDGNTIPFIARYRKEMTGQLDEVVLWNISERLNYLRSLQQRKEEVIRLIDEQNKLTDELKKAIEIAETLQQIEDLYRPYRQKRRTRASIAKEKGLEPLAELLFNPNEVGNLEAHAAQYINPDLDLLTIEDVIQGAKDIIAEMISDDARVRQVVRTETLKLGQLLVQAKDKEVESVYEMYYDYNESIKTIRHHRILAINRGEKEEFLKVKIQIDEQHFHQKIQEVFSPFSIFRSIPEVLLEALEDSYKRLIAPSIEREIRNILTEKAEEQAIHIFSANLRQLLLQPPVKNKTILGVDPAYRTGCKLAVIDPTGKVLEIMVIYPTPPQNKIEESKKVIKELVKKHQIEIITIGNGTASRETEQFVADVIKEIEEELFYIIISEAGASVYSASPIAREEFPSLDVAERSAISIARRLQDPLAELVKIDPKAIGVGQYQHDVSQKKLEDSLKQVVESVVNYVGVDVNTASVSLLQYIAGMNKTVAKNIVSYRETKGKFKNREELKQVPRFGDKTYLQAIGFLRLDGENPLDKTSIHPESYPATYQLLEMLSISLEQIEEVKNALDALDLGKASHELELGLPTLTDIVQSLIRPVRDPRDEMPKPILFQDVLKIEDLKVGMDLQGTVRNIVDFGAFIDIGVKVDGLVHISQLSNQYIKHPLDVVSVGDIVNVKVLDIDVKKNRISLTMK